MTSTESARVRDNRGGIKSGAIGAFPAGLCRNGLPSRGPLLNGLPPRGPSLTGLPSQAPFAPLEPGQPARAAVCRAWAYRRAALIHPSNLIALAAVLMLGLVNPSGQIVLLGLGAE